jgi:hypothetical protein
MAWNRTQGLQSAGTSIDSAGPQSTEGIRVMDAALEVRRFDTPDDAIDMREAGRIFIIKMADGTTGMRATFEPGWTWEKDEKPLLGSPPTCHRR